MKRLLNILVIAIGTYLSYIAFYWIGVLFMRLIDAPNQLLVRLFKSAKELL